MTGEPEQSESSEAPLLVAARVPGASPLAINGDVMTSDVMTSVVHFDLSAVVRRTMVLSRVSRRAGLLFAGLPAPRNRVSNPANASHSQFERLAVFGEQCAFPVSFTAPRHVRVQIKINGPLDRQLWLIRATGCTMQRNTPTPRSIESKTVSTCQNHQRPEGHTSLSLKRMAVCLG